MARIVIESAPAVAGLPIGTLLLMADHQRQYIAEDGSIWFIANGQNVQAKYFPELAVVFGMATASFRLPNLKDFTRPPLNYYIKVKDSV